MESGSLELGAVQQTLFIPLAGRARESARRRPILRDPKAAEILAAVEHDTKFDRGMGNGLTVRRTAILDMWVREFLAEHPAGTVVELGTGMNTRFERVDNGSVHWLDLDLPDTIALRQRFFTDDDRRRMLAGSILDNDWMDTLAAGPGPYFIVSDGVLVYLPEAELRRVFGDIVRRFPGARLAFDTYSSAALAMHEKSAAKTGLAKWSWACDDPAELESLGLRLIESTTATPPPKPILRTMPLRSRLIVRLLGPMMGTRFMRVNLFEVPAASQR